MTKEASPLIQICVDLAACRKRSGLRMAFLKKAEELIGAQSTALYSADITGKKLVPLATTHNLSLGTMPLFSLEVLRDIPTPIQVMHASAAVYIEQPEKDDVKGRAFREQLFDSSGCFVGFRLSTGIPASHYYLFCLMSDSVGEKILNYKSELLNLASLLHALMPLVGKYETAEEELAKEQMARRKRQPVNRESAKTLLSERLVGSSRAMCTVRDKLAGYAANGFSVLVQGETGTGKELAARALHNFSDRAGKAFIAENVTALSETLMESELFGHVKGAFTGANEAKKGLIELAHKGTLFLDEIADMPMGQQTKLLRVLQEKAVRPVGGKETVPVDFRLITATHRDLRTCIAEGTFREDLYHRIAQLVVTMPTLEDRPEDIEPIANRFLSEVAAQQGTTVKRLSPESLALLQSRPYKGNVRELQNCLTSAIFATGCGPVITEDIILSVLEQKAETEQPRNNGPENFVPPPPDAHVHTGLRDAIQSYERLILEKAHKQFAGNRSQMADFLDIPKRTLVNKLHQHNINLSGDIL